MEHAAIPSGEIHTPYQWIVADMAARVALAPESTDLTKTCLQMSDKSVWRLTGIAPSAWELDHAHSYGDLVDKPALGTAAAKDTGTGAENVILGDDPRLTDARPPTSHTHSDKADLVDGKIPAAQLPSYVDDVLEYDNRAAFPGTGEAGKIYVALDTSKTWRWSGSTYVEMQSLPDSTDSVTEGTTNLYFTAARVRDAVLTGLSAVTQTAIATTDSVLSALGKLQGQFNKITAAGWDLASGASAAAQRTTLELENHEKVVVGASSTTGIGSAPSAWGLSGLTALQLQNAGLYGYSTNESGVTSNAYYGAGAWRYMANGSTARYTQSNGAHNWFSAAEGVAGNAINNSNTMILSREGLLLLGVPSGTCHVFKKATAGFLQGIIAVQDSDGAVAVFAGGQHSAASITTNSALYLGKDSTSNRSANLTGTLNASGADCAEYERTNGEFVGQIAKGAIVGFDTDGKLTLRFDDAVSFGVKSTDPHLVGGDTWGTEEALGMTRPEPPQFTAPEYAGSPQPADLPAQPVEPSLTLPPEPVKQDGETDDVFAACVAWWQQACQAAEAQHSQAQADYADALAAWEVQADAHAAALAQYEADQAAHKAAVEAAQAEIDTETMPTYQKDLAKFEAALEAARQQVDRIAYSGKVPCNVYGAKPGDYIVAVRTADGGIAGVAIGEDEISFAQYRKAVGRVRKIEADGRANIAVMVH